MDRLKDDSPGTFHLGGQITRGGQAVWVRQAAVAGRFYPDDAKQLRDFVRREVDQSLVGPEVGAKALIVPHAGYVYSAPVAASAYASLGSSAEEIRRVLLLGTCHSPGVSGLVTTGAASFETPLGRVPVEETAVANALGLTQVQCDDEAHRRDHALEVQLPFLQVVLGDFRILPLLVGNAEIEGVAELLDVFWDGPSTLIVVSSDLSHYHSYDEARPIDRATATAIEQLDDQALEPGSACGRNAIAGLLIAARRHGLCCRTVDLRSSGDTAGRRDRVVGYGAFVFSSVE